MTSTMITFAQTAATSVASVVTAPIDPTSSDGLLGMLRGWFQDGSEIAKLGINFLVLAIGGYTIAKAKMAVAAVVMVLLVGSLVLWWVNGGLFSTSQKIEKDMKSAPTLVHDLRPKAGAITLLPADRPSPGSLTALTPAA